MLEARAAERKKERKRGRKEGNERIFVLSRMWMENDLCRSVSGGAGILSLFLLFLFSLKLPGAF